MGMSDYQAGYYAYFNDLPFDPTRPQGWQEGWEDAEDDDYDHFDDHIDMETY